MYYAYNAVGDLVRMEDWTGINTFEYDGANNLTAVTEDDGRTTTYEYDDCGNMVFEYIRGNGNNNGNGDGNGSINKTSIVVKNVVVDYNTETFEPLMEHEVNGLDYKYVYGNDRLSVDISPINNSMSIVENGDHIRLYYHMDYLGTADYLTSPVSGRVEAWTHYNEWGLIVHNAVLKCGQRELDLVKRYATHDFDSVLEMYYAKARFYDAHDRRFTAVDPILDPSGYDLREYVENPVQFVQYLYVENNTLIFIDLNGCAPYTVKRYDGTYELMVTPYGVDFLMLLASGGPFGSAATDLLLAFVADIVKMDPNHEAVVGYLADAADLLADKPYAGLAGLSINSVKFGWDLFVTGDNRIGQALQSHFPAKVWYSESRELVEKKYYIAFALVSQLIENGDLEVKKAKDIFDKSSFHKTKYWGDITTQYDSFTGENMTFFKDDYYFVLKCPDKENMYQDILDIISRIK